MMIRILVIFSFVLLPALVAHAQPEDRPSIDHEIQTFLSAHCVRCHGPKKQEGKIRLDRAGSADGELLRGVRGQLRDGLMPPEEEAQPSAALKRRFLEQLSVVIKSAGSNGKLTEDKLPNKGNLVPHELLFGKPAKSGNGASPARIWRLSPEAYRSMAGRASTMPVPRKSSRIVRLDSKSERTTLRKCVAGFRARCRSILVRGTCRTISLLIPKHSSNTS